MLNWLSVKEGIFKMKLKKIIAIALSAATIASVGISAEAADKKDNGRDMTMRQAVIMAQMPMNLDGNTNYLLVCNHSGIRFYIDLASIVIKEDDDKMCWWAQNIIEVNDEGKYVGQFTQEFCYDRTMDKKNTRQWNGDNRTWEVLDTYETNSRYQADARAYKLGYIFAFQGGNPVK
jgi:hypothetical protein